MDYNEIKQLIDDNIQPNTNQDITAIVANLVMTGMIDYTRDSIVDIVNQGFGAGAFTWLDVEHGAVIPYPQMSAGRARVVRILKDNVEYEDGEATIGGVNGITIKRHALVICLEATNEMANDGMQETVGDRFAVIQSDNEIIFLSEEPTQGVENKLYINLSSGTMKVWHNGGWIDLTFSLTTIGNSGAATFTGNTLNIPNYTLSGLGGVPLTRSITINGVTQNLSANRTWNISPDYSSLTNQRHIKKVGSGLADSNIQDTAVGSEVLGRLDSTATVERRTLSAKVTSSFTIDLNNPSGHYDLTLSGNTSINFSNMITALKSTVITLVVSGNYSLLFPSWLKPMPNNDDYYSVFSSDVNLITILIRHGGSSPSGIYSLTNVDIS